MMHTEHVTTGGLGRRLGWVAAAGALVVCGGFAFVVRSDHFLVSDDPIAYVYGFVFALSVGLLASVLPAIRASRVEPVDVLRGQVG